MFFYFQYEDRSFLSQRRWQNGVQSNIILIWNVFVCVFLCIKEFSSHRQTCPLLSKPFYPLTFPFQFALALPFPAAYEPTVLAISSKCGREVEGLIFFHMRPNLLRTFCRIQVICGLALQLWNDTNNNNVIDAGGKVCSCTLHLTPSLHYRIMLLDGPGARLLYILRTNG